MTLIIIISTALLLTYGLILYGCILSVSKSKSTIEKMADDNEQILYLKKKYPKLSSTSHT